MADGKARDLILKYLRDELSPLEFIELQEWVNLSAANKLIFDELSDPELLQASLVEFHLAPSTVRAKLDLLLRQEALSSPILLPEPGVAAVRRFRPWLYGAAVAACFGLVVAAVWLFRQRPAGSSQGAQTAAVHDIAPGGNKALLTLSDGSKIILENAGNGALAKQGNTSVSKDSNQLAYAPLTNHNAPIPSAEVLYNELTTPKSGQYQVVLPDGTKVFLNNASSLRYPTAFSGSDRQVTLSGEAFFVVAHDAAKPFIVHTDRLSVQVLGTSFDVMAYTDDRSARATLVSGAVSVRTSLHQVQLHPGEQALTSSDEGLSSHAVDADEVIAWTRGYFHFNQETIDDVLRQLSRWYDISVRFDVPVPGYVYDGEIGRDLSLASILKHLEKPDLHFRIEDRKLIVTH